MNKKNRKDASTQAVGRLRRAISNVANDLLPAGPYRPELGPASYRPEVWLKVVLIEMGASPDRAARVVSEVIKLRDQLRTMRRRGVIYPKDWSLVVSPATVFNIEKMILVALGPRPKTVDGWFVAVRRLGKL